MKKKFKTFLSGLLGISLVAAMAVTGVADSGSKEDGGNYLIYPGADENDPDIVCPEGYERVPYIGESTGVTFKMKETEAPDFTALTPDKHNEYCENELYVSDDLYIQTDKTSKTENGKVCEYKTVTLRRSIYNSPDKTDEALYAVMTTTAEFKWDGETARIIGSPNTKTVEGAAYSGDEIWTKMWSSQSDQGSNAFFGNKYACAEYVTVIGKESSPKKFRIYISVNRNGELNVET